MTQPIPILDAATKAGVLVLTVRATAIDSGNAERLLAAATDAISGAGRGLRGVVLDLAAVGFVNSRGLAACIEVARAAEVAGARTAAARCSPDIRRVLDVMKVDRLLPPFDDLDGARAAVLARD